MREDDRVEDKWIPWVTESSRYQGYTDNVRRAYHQ